MIADPYSPLVRKLFATPAHVAPKAGEPDNADSVFMEGQGVSVGGTTVAKSGEWGFLTMLSFTAPSWA